MKVIKGEKYLCSNGPLKGKIFRAEAISQFHVICENLSDATGVEYIQKFYFVNSFRAYNHEPTVKMNPIQVQQIAMALNLKMREFVDSGMIEVPVFMLMSNDILSVLMTEFLED